MGCSVSTAIATSEISQKRHTKNSGTSELSNAVFDPRLPLTIRQKFNLNKSWKGIARNMQSTGTNMFLRMFESNDDVLKLFKTLNSCADISQLRASKILEHHVGMVMYTIDEAISSLDDLDTVISMLHALGKSHISMANFKPDILWRMEEPFLMAVKETLGDRYTANVEHIYRKMIKFLLETLVDGCRKAGLEQLKTCGDNYKDDQETDLELFYIAGHI